MKHLLLTILLFLFSYTFVWAQDVFIIINQKQQAKKSQSWSLLDWMNTKKQMAQMDQWLALNSSPVIFEGVIGGSSLKTTEEFYSTTSPYLTSSEHRGFEANLGLHFLLFGFEFDYGKHSSDTTSLNGEFSIRIYGTSEQGTRLKLLIGRRDLSWNNEIFKNNFWGAEMSLYVLPFLGVEGLYRNYLKEESKNGEESYGHYNQYGAFLDISFIQLYWSQFEEKIQGITSPQRRHGQKVGLRLFF